MSLINQMLRDLDKRHALGQEAGALPETVRPAADAVAKRRKGPSPLFLGLLALAGVAGVALWFMPDKTGTPPPVAPAPIPTPPVAARAPEAVAPPPLAKAAPAVAESPKLEAAPAPAEAPAAEDVAPRLRVAASLGQPKAPPKTGAAPAKVEKVAVEPTPEERAERQYREALALLDKGQLREALEGLYRVTREQPAFSPAWQVLTRLLLEQARPDEALRVMREVTAARPRDLAAAMQLARLQAEYQGDAEALRSLRAVAESGAGDADYHGFMATLLQRQRQYDEAAAEYRKGLAKKPAEGRWWVGLGLVLEAQGKIEEARKAWRAALETGTLPHELRQFAEGKLRAP